jgi:UDP-N-acetylglucosamine 2-epimerase (hydrolysing)
MKKIVFLSGTRADFGKLKSLISIVQNSKEFNVHIFVTGMHLNATYGYTVDEIEKSGFKNIFKFINHDSIEYMDRTLAKTIEGFSQYVNQISPDLIIVHGDRVEALAGAIVGSLNNILVAHIEGGEVSGTIDELIRHSVTKMSHIHLVSNEEAKKRLIQLGEFENSIFILGSPDLDLMADSNLPNFQEVLNYYDIPFNEYAIAMFHPVTTEYENISRYARNFIDALIESNEKFVLIYPNNDLGSREILKEFNGVRSNNNFKIFPSLRFEFFLRLLKESKFIIGNSSAGIREAPFYNVPTIDIGSRQLNRAKFESVFHCNYEKENIVELIKLVSKLNFSKVDQMNNYHFGKGRSDLIFQNLLQNHEFWRIQHQKQFQEINFYAEKKNYC